MNAIEIIFYVIAGLSLVIALLLSGRDITITKIATKTANDERNICFENLNGFSIF